jgi:hypothetical protein
MNPLNPRQAARYVPSRPAKQPGLWVPEDELEAAEVDEVGVEVCA